MFKGRQREAGKVEGRQEKLAVGWKGGSMEEDWRGGTRE